MAASHPVITPRRQEHRVPSTAIVPVRQTLPDRSDRSDRSVRGSIRLTHRVFRFAGSAVLAGIAGAFAAYPAGCFWEWIVNLPGLPI